jgi:predicted Zn finger-like uncharacterized protein
MLPKRMSEETMDEAEFTNNDSTNSTSEPHVLVSCPSCKTKFAVESSLIASYETPRFHCSRCDSVFEAKQDKKEAPAPQPSSRWVLQDESATTPSNVDGYQVAKRPTHQEPLKSTDFTLGELPELDNFDQSGAPDTLENRAGLSILGFRPTASRRHSSSLTRSEARALVAQIKQDEVELTDPFSLFDNSSEVEQDTKVQSRITGTAQDEPATGLSEHTRAQESVKLRQNSTKNSSQPRESAEPRTSQPPHVSGLLNRVVRGFSPRNQGMLSLSMPLATALAALCVVGLFIRIFPSVVDSVFRAAVPGFISGRTAELPPPEVSVQDLNLTLEKTQSKESIPVVRGVVFNASDKAYEDVSIEALGFNSRGELLVRARAPLRSALSREKISDLSLEAVKKFQNALSASNASIKAGEKVAFSVALFLQDAEAQEVTYFSARVFSVGRAK